ncbi:hypothetical protein MNB_SV-13-756 [hydrothermal vent metagenome]|uniref:Uncharacterized protein n=1 Tax=hydrothermal vent metagenome TaxID=652676 RepID=A0A1W1CUR6_9ZZZZ
MVEEIAKQVKVQIFENNTDLIQPKKVFKQASLFDFDEEFSKQLVG